MELTGTKLAAYRTARRARLERKFGTTCVVCGAEGLSGKGLNFAPAKSSVLEGFTPATQCSKCRALSEVRHLKYAVESLARKLRELEVRKEEDLNGQFLYLNALSLLEVIVASRAVITRAELPKGKSVDPIPVPRSLSDLLGSPT
jgi:hypothetical protein